jgi:hypothetical protein
MHLHVRCLLGVTLGWATLMSCPVRLTAQVPSCVTPVAAPFTTTIPHAAADLPVDRIADLLAIELGVNSLDRGDLSIRGAGAGATAVYLDGLPITPGHRGFVTSMAGASYFGGPSAGLDIGTNGFGVLELTRGNGSAEESSARGGVIGVVTAGCADSEATGLRAGWATDALFGKQNGLGFNRLTADGGYRFGRLQLGAAAVVEGQGTERLGLDQNGSPVYLADGVDTTVTVAGPSGPVPVDVLRFKPSDGVRIPSTANSNYAVQARLGYQLGDRHTFRLTAFASQDQAREFDYADLYNPRQLRANRGWSRVVTGSWHGLLREGESLRLGAEAHLSWQTDRAILGPLTTASERGSRDPFGGFLLGPLGFRFDFDNFAVNEELVRNFRTNSGRLSPYDLTNPSQYSLSDQYRNNAYGLTGFSESGGPVGLLSLYRENRLVGKGVVDAQLRGRHHLRAGAEIVRYDIDYYSSQLTSQARSEAYVESPTRAALFADYELQVGIARLGAGLRYDRFHSGASRPDFPRISTSPGFDPANPTAGFIADKSHGRLSPRLRGSVRATDQLLVFGGLSWLAQVPDFAAVFAGINTDLSVTNTSHAYGTDLDFEHARLGEIGARYEPRPGTVVTGTVWNRKDEDIVAGELKAQFDPQKQANVDLVRYRNVGSRSATGLELQIDQRISGNGAIWLGYTYVNAKHPMQAGFPASPSTFPAAGVRPHTLAGGVRYETGADTRALAGILRDVGVYGAVRFASGTAYTACPVSNPADNSVLSDQSCAGPIAGDFNAERLPSLRLIDLRITRAVSLGGASLVVFADARNLLNSRNVTRVFAQTGTTSNSPERDRIRSGNLSEFANEATANGVLRSDGSIDLSFGGVADPRAACGSWTNAAGSSATPNCVYLLGAEQRFGNGDHVFSVAEQTRASDALYQVARGQQNFTGPGRRVRIGLEVRF